MHPTLGGSCIQDRALYQVNTSPAARVRAVWLGPQPAGGPIEQELCLGDAPSDYDCGRLQAVCNALCVHVRHA